MKSNSLPLLPLCAWLGAATAQAALPAGWGTWELKSAGQLNILLATQRGVAAIGPDFATGGLEDVKRPDFKEISK